MNIKTLITELRDGLENVERDPWRFINGVGVRNDRGFFAQTHEPFLYEGQDNRYNRDIKTHYATASHIARCSPDNIRAVLDSHDALVEALEVAAKGMKLGGFKYSESLAITKALKAAKGEDQ